MTVEFVQVKTASGLGQDVTVTLDYVPRENSLLIAIVSAEANSIGLQAETDWTMGPTTTITPGGDHVANMFWKVVQTRYEDVIQLPASTSGTPTDVWCIVVAEYANTNVYGRGFEANASNSDGDTTKTTTGACNPTDDVPRLIVGAAFNANNSSWSSWKIKGSTTGVTERGSIGKTNGAVNTSCTLFDWIDTTVSGNYTAEAVCSGAAAAGGAFIAIAIPMADGDRRYGEGNKYGNGRLYGTSVPPIVEDRFQWSVNVTWNTKYGLENEAIYMTGLRFFRGRRSFLNPNGQGFAPVETGRARVTLDNSDGRYDAWNTSSPLYPDVVPGKDITIRIRDLDSGILYDVFTGVILDIETIGYGADARVTLVCEDGWYFLRNNVTYVGSVRQQYSISRILNMIFGNEFGDFIDPFKYRYGTNFESATDTIRYWWSSNNISIADMCTDLAQSYFCKFFVARDGKATFYDRQNTRTSVQTITQSILLKDISNNQPWVNQRDFLKIRTHIRKTAANQVLWSLSEAFQVLEGETETINPIFTYNGFIVPTGTITYNPGDYHMNTAEDGSGTDLSSSFIVSDPATPNYVPGGVIYSWGFGDTTVLNLVNNSGSDGYVTDFDIYGIPIYESGSVEVCRPNVVGGNRRELVIDSLWYQNINRARQIARIYGPQVAAVRQFPVIQFDTRPEGLVPDLFDIETVSISQLGISATDFEVGGIELETTNETCQSFIVRHWLEPHFDSS